MELHPGPVANLVIRPERLGDLVLAIPVMRALRESFPSEEVHVLTDDRHAPILDRQPYVDRVVAVPWNGGGVGQRPSWRQLLPLLERGVYRRVAVLYANFPVWNLMLALRGVRKVAQLGGTWPAVVLGHRMVLRRHARGERHMVDWYLDVARALGATTARREPELFLDEAERTDFARRFGLEIADPRQRRVLVHPFGPSAAPNVSLSRYATVARKIVSELGAEVWVTGTSSEAAHWPLPPTAGVRLDWLGRLTTRDLLSAISLVDVVLAGSTGVLHAAAALGRRCVGLYCPSPDVAPAVWGPVCDQSITLTAPGAYCRYVGAGPQSCMGWPDCDLSSALDAQSIVDAVSRLLAQGA